MSPRVTVLMSVYNGARYLQEAVDSILAQTFRDFELLIIDDASSDASPQILARASDPRVRILRNDHNLGLTRSLNLGLAEARGELIARHDDDDRSHPERLADQVSFLDDNPDVAVVGTQVRVVDDTGRRRRRLDFAKPLSQSSIRFRLMATSPMVHGSVMFRRSVVRDEFGGYDETYLTSQDMELWSRVAMRHPMQNLSRAHLDFRVHRRSVTANHYSRDNVLRVVPIFERNVVALTGNIAGAEEWASLWVAITNHGVMGDPERPQRAVSLMDLLRRDFLTREPRALEDVGIAVTYGIVQLTIARYLARHHRRYALAAITRATSAAPLATLRALPRLAVAAIPGADNAFSRLRRKENG